MAGHFLRECLQAPAAPWTICNVTTGATLATSVLPAFDRLTRKRGLLGLERLDTGAAMILAPCAGVHTWFMHFPIDILFVSRQGDVLKVRRGVDPWRLAVRLGAFAVIELAAATSVGTDPGHRLALVPNVDAHRMSRLRRPAFDSRDESGPSRSVV
ncbi:MAG: DUF192 domain-containing protein [Vicinamibacterales bacterium]